MDYRTIDAPALIPLQLQICSMQGVGCRRVSCSVDSVTAVGSGKALLSIDTAREQLLYAPVYSWRDHIP